MGRTKVGKHEVKGLKFILLNAVRSHGGFMTRPDIAKVIGRDDRLHHYDIQLLNELVESGYIETKKYTRGVTMTMTHYRFIS